MVYFSDKTTDLKHDENIKKNTQLFYLQTAIFRATRILVEFILSVG